MDDNHDVADSLQILLRMLGHETRTVYAGKDALAVIRDWTPEIAFIDIGMPDMDGYQLGQAIRSQDLRPRPLLVALSGYGSDRNRQRSLKAGFDHHLLKPAALDDIEALLAELPDPAG